MAGPSLRGIKAEIIIVFVLGVLFLALGVYGVYYLLAVELPTGHYSRVPFAAAAGIFLGAVMIWQTYSIFIPLKKNSSMQSIVCPSCGALVGADAEVCEKCKRPLEDQN